MCETSYVSVILDVETLAAWRTVLRVQARVIARAEEALVAAELPPLAWYDVLLTLSEAEAGALRMYEVADAIVMSRSGLTRLIDRLEEAGLTERRNCPSDRRGNFVAITEPGRAMLRRIWPVYEAVIRAEFGERIDDPRAVARLLSPAT